jgi:hypothetical protein
MHSERMTDVDFSQMSLNHTFFENDIGRTVMVNGVRYRSILTEFLWPKLNNTTDLCFQQDGVTCHKVAKQSLYCAPSSLVL